MDPQREQAADLQGNAAVVAVVVLIACLLGGSLIGWRAAGPLGGLLGILVGTAIGVLVFTMLRARASRRRFDEHTVPDVREMPPDQAVQVLSAMIGATASASASSSWASLQVQDGILGEIAKARARATDGDLDGALAKLRALAEDNPRSPAAPAEIVRVLDGHDEHAAERLRAAATALRLSINGGMNRLALRVHDQLSEAERDQLALDDAAWSRLATILEANGAPEAAVACRGRSS